MPTLADQIAPKPQEPSGLGGWLASIGDEMAGAFARYGRRSGAQRDASLALMSQAADPNTDPLTGAGMKALGLAGLVTHPLAFFPTREEWDQRLQAAGNDSRLGRSIGGFLSDLPSLIDPQMAAGGAVLATAPLAAKMMNKADDVADAGIIAYHGSPHSFDKFDMSKIGTGEGNQAYMRGLYFAENEGVAKTYRDMLSDQPLGVPAIGWQQRMDWTEAQDDAYGLVDKALEELQIDIAQGGATRPDWSRVTDKVRQLAPRGKENEILRELDTMADKYGWKEFVNKNPGSMYQVKINATPEEFLNWDIPLSQQPKKVQEALRGLDPSLFAVDTWASKLDGAKTKGRTVSYGPDNRTGEAAARAFEENLGGPEMAAEKLKAAGIKGVRYKDAGSRGAEGGTYNYVVFDDKLITILKKYGIPMTAGAGGAMMVAGQDMPPEFASQMGGT